MSRGSIIKLDPEHPNRIPTAVSDRQVQGMIDMAVKAERERCISAIRNELLTWERQGGIGVGWSWQRWREQMLAVLRRV